MNDKTIMDNKTLATILFRVFGISYLVYGAFYAPYLLISGSFNGTLIMSNLTVLTYIAGGICLFLLGKPLATLVIKGLDRNSVLPPLPPTFKN